MSSSGDFIFLLDTSKMYVYKNGELLVTDNGLIYDKKSFNFSAMFISNNGKYYGWYGGGYCSEDTYAVVLINTDYANGEYTYEFTEGANQTFKVNGSSGIVFKINGNHELFKEVYIDGNLVSTNNYVVKRGSTIITLTNEYSKSLADGKEHDLKVVYTNGKEVTTKFKAEEEQTNNESNSCKKIENVYYDKNGNATTKEQHEKECLVNPDTGHIVPFVIGLVIIGGIILIKKKPLKRI